MMAWGCICAISAKLWAATYLEILRDLNSDIYTTGQKLLRQLQYIDS